MLRRLAVALGALALGLGILPAAGADSTSQLRRSWGPNCATAGQLARVSFVSGSRITVHAQAAEAFTALAATTQSFRYHVRPRDTGAMNCRRITGGSGVSLHGLGIAADLNWQTNPYGRRLVTDMPPAMVTAIKAIRTNAGRQAFRSGGDFRPMVDPMHFEVTVSPAVLASGINWSTGAR